MTPSSRTSPPPHCDFEHVAVIHDGPDELAALLSPQLGSAIGAGEHVLVCTPPRAREALREKLGPRSSGVEYLADDVRYSTPTKAMKFLHDFAQRGRGQRAPAVWSIGAIPFGGRPDADWLRYEAAVNHLLSHLPLKAVCAFDVSDCPPAVVAAAATTHAELIDTGGRRASDRFEAAPVAVPRTEIPHRPPDLSESPNTPADARRMVRQLLGGHAAGSNGDDLELIVSELVTNAHHHGEGPVGLAVWCDRSGSRYVVAVTDQGPGIADPFFDLRPPGPVPGGAGLWIVGQLADRVTSDRLPGGQHRVTATISLN